MKSHPPYQSAQPRSPASRMLLPLVPVYAAAVAVKNLAYTRHWLATRHLAAPVISVGNLSVGGAGKTPLVIHMAELLATRGFAVDVLSRGYGRSSTRTEQVELCHPGTKGLPVSESAADLNAEGVEDAGRFGDEPVLIASAARVPVFVGSSRYAAGLLAEQGDRAGPRLHLLDDGFQHRRLARAADIVVLHRGDFTSGLLPAGRLREPLSALRRASVAVLRVEDAGCEPMLRRRGFHLPVWLMQREIILPADVASAPAFAFCGIAHGGDFFASLTRAGVLLAGTRAFPDHHAYTDADVSGLLISLREAGAATLLTTEKDLVRLSAVHRARLGQAAMLRAVPLRARLLDEEAALEQLRMLAGLPRLTGTCTGL